MNYDLNNLPPSELIALKKYYDEKSSKSFGCRSEYDMEVEEMSKKIEEILYNIIKGS